MTVQESAWQDEETGPVLRRLVELSVRCSMVREESWRLYTCISKPEDDPSAHFVGCSPL